MEVAIYEDTPELANNQENQPPLAPCLIIPPPPPPPQPLPTAASSRRNRNRLKKLRRQRRQQRPKQLENRSASGVHIQNGVYANTVDRSTVNNHMHWENCLNSSSPAK